MFNFMNRILQTLHQKISIMIFVGCLLAGFSLVMVAGATHWWGGYHWARSSNPLALKLGDNVSSAWDSYLTIASADWSKSSVLDTSVDPGATDPKPCRPTFGRVEVCNSKYGSNGWLGLAQVWVSGSHIVQGTAKMNDTYFNTRRYNTPAWRQFVVCQEVGHTFGLDHQDENSSNPNLGSCMDYTNDPDGGPGGASETDPSNERPNQHDYDQIALIYAHLDAAAASSVSAFSAPAAAGGDAADNASEWGRAIRQSGDGRTSLYERDLGRGNKVFTFVIWAR